MPAGASHLAAPKHKARIKQGAGITNLPFFMRLFMRFLFNTLFLTTTGLLSARQAQQGMLSHSVIFQHPGPAREPVAQCQPGLPPSHSYAIPRDPPTLLYAPAGH